MHRRSFLQLSTGAFLIAAAPGCGDAPSSPTARESPLRSPASQGSGKIIIGQATVASGLPFFCALEQGFFREAGLNVIAQKMESPQITIAGMIANRLQGCSNGTASGSLAVGAIAAPNLFRIIAANPTNQKFVLDEIIVAKDSPIRRIADLQGQPIGCGLGPQNLAIARALLAKHGVQAAQITPMKVSQHVAAVASGQIAAAYTLEPSGTIGTQKGLTRILETGVVAKYILNDPLAPWFGGAAALTTQFITAQPQLAQNYIAAYRRGVDYVRQQPAAARKFLEKYTPITRDLLNAVPLADYRMHDEFTQSDLRYFQQYFDFLQSAGVLSRRVEVAPLIYRRA